MASVGTAQVDVELNRRALESDIEKAGNAAGHKMGQTIGSSLKNTLVAIGIGEAIRGSIEQAEQAEAGIRRTENVLRTTGEAANVSAEDVGNLAKKLGDVAGVDDDVIRGGENLLLTFRNIKNVGADKVFDEATTASEDLAAAMGKDLNSAVILVGKALNDPAKGLTRLERVGVSFTAQQKDQIKTLAESGRTLDAQRIILKELQTEFGGAAGAMATDSGRAKAAMQDLEESAGAVLAPALGHAATALRTLANAFGKLPKDAQTAILLGGAGFAIYERFGESLAVAGAHASTMAAELVATAASEGTLGAATAATTGILNSQVVAIGAVAAAGYSLIKLAQTVRSEQGKADQDAADFLEKFGSKFDSQTGSYHDLQTQLGKTSDAIDVMKKHGDEAINPLLKRRYRDAEAGLRGYQGQLQKTADEARKLAHAHHITTTEALHYGTEANYAAAKSDEAMKRVEAGIKRRALPTLEALKNKWKDAGDQAKDAEDTFTKALNVGLPGDTEQAAIDATRANDDVYKSIKENGNTFDISTEKGRQNREAILNSKSAIVDYAKALIDSGTPLAEVKRKTQELVKGLDDQAHAAGATNDQVAALNQEMGLTPERLDIAFATPGLDTAIAKTQQLNIQLYATLALQAQQERDAAAKKNLRNHGITLNGGDLTPHGTSVHVHGDVHVDAKHKPAREIGREIHRSTVRKVAQ